MIEDDRCFQRHSGEFLEVQHHFDQRKGIEPEALKRLLSRQTLRSYVQSLRDVCDQLCAYFGDAAFVSVVGSRIGWELRRSYLRDDLELAVEILLASSLALDFSARCERKRSRSHEDCV